MNDRIKLYEIYKNGENTVNVIGLNEALHPYEVSKSMMGLLDHHLKFLSENEKDDEIKKIWFYINYIKNKNFNNNKSFKKWILSLFLKNAN